MSLSLLQFRIIPTGTKHASNSVMTIHLIYSKYYCISTRLLVGNILSGDIMFLSEDNILWHAIVDTLPMDGEKCFTFCYKDIQKGVSINSLRWRHNDHYSVSNHQPHGCLLNRLFRRRWKKTSKLRVTGLCEGNSPGPVNSPHKGPVTRKMFPFDDVIMLTKALNLSCTRNCAEAAK